CRRASSSVAWPPGPPRRRAPPSRSRRTPCCRQPSLHLLAFVPPVRSPGPVWHRNSALRYHPSVGTTATQPIVAMRRRPPRSERVPPVGRGPKVRAAVLAATLAELAARGSAALTVDDVARRAGVHKTTVYRRWNDRESLVADALTDLAAADVPVPDTGSVETDLREHGRAVVRFLTGPPGRAV